MVAGASVRFRCVDGVDVGPDEYPLNTSVAKLKALLVEQLKGREDVKTPPRSGADLKLIHGGKILENGKTLADYKLEAGVDEDGDPVITTVLLWIRPEGVAPAREEEKDEKDFQKGCACVIS
jgi:hypothetical protein